MNLPGRSKKLAKIIAISAAGVLVATLGAAYALDQINRYGDVPCREEDAQPSLGNKAAALTVGFTTLEEIVANSDAIVVADVDRCVKVHSHPKSKEVRLTDFEVTIEKTIRGDLPEGRTVIVQLVTSGEDSDYHIMKAGERYVLFLTFTQITSNYVPVGGPQGRFLIDNDLVYSLDGIYSDLDFLKVNVDAMPLDDFVTESQSLS